MATQFTIKDILPAQYDAFIDKIIGDMYSDGLKDKLTDLNTLKYPTLQTALLDWSLRDYVAEQISTQLHIQIRYNESGNIY